jgi:hypothetical protein
VSFADASKKLPEFTKQVEEGNRLHADAGTFKFAGGANPIKHVIYIIKENRTYDQIFGDLKEANGDPSLTMYGREITPNEHKLALQFGIFDNFYDSGEVSGNGHVWSTAATASDYNEATWQIAYRGHERTYDFGGSVAEEYPVERGIPNVNSPQTGYLWVNAASHGITYRDYGEFIEADFCPLKSPDATPKEGNPQPQGEECEHDAIRQGEPLPATLGSPKGSSSPYPWPVPLSKETVATMKELKNHTDLAYPPFNVDYPDQLRADEFLNEFQNFVQARKDGKGEQLPNLVIMHLPNDHTGGTRAGRATPSASVADNDLAEELSRRSRTARIGRHRDFHAREDGAQDGVVRVDAHRSVVLVISKSRRLRVNVRWSSMGFHDGQRGTQHGGTSRPAADESERRLRATDGQLVFGCRESSAFSAGHFEPGQRAYLQSQYGGSKRGEGFVANGFHASRCRRYEGAQCDSVARAQGKREDAGGQAHGLSGQSA